MAKPILVAYCSFDEKNYKVFTENEMAIVENIKKHLNNEYHVLTTAVVSNENFVKFECLNDSKGLKDVDIEQLIEQFNQKK